MFPMLAHAEGSPIDSMVISVLLWPNQGREEKTLRSQLMFSSPMLTSKE